ncbi:CGNR zinc finger domain-containing protein [Streptomyces smyrnaeus]|uniref:CGNR zinc finger domain-containing protein n=1 Tax=Streptomyces smyrnaeus TaxID=1387713 RepID=A0ABS3Y4K5_9ACTN|nr:CGNR zinc finger domain-containing protein [Streptomyces smyrnaeus]
MREAPASAQLIEAFANTVDVELGTDELETPSGLAAWLVAHGLLDRDRRIDPDDHTLCLRLRTGIREELGINVGDTADAALLARADEALRELPVLISVRGGGGQDSRDGVLSPAPDLPPIRKALAHLAIAWSELTLAGEAGRLKRCAEHSCAWVFWDVSKNRSRRWCSMRVCGNRAKARRHTAKQASATTRSAPTQRAETPERPAAAEQTTSPERTPGPEQTASPERTASAHQEAPPASRAPRS